LNREREGETGRHDCPLSPPFFCLVFSSVLLQIRSLFFAPSCALPFLHSSLGCPASLRSLYLAGLLGSAGFTERAQFASCFLSPDRSLSCSPCSARVLVCACMRFVRMARWCVCVSATERHIVVGTLIFVYPSICPSVACLPFVLSVLIFVSVPTIVPLSLSHCHEKRRFI